jgi:hypothetical protein
MVMCQEEVSNPTCAFNEGNKTREKTMKVYIVGEVVMNPNIPNPTMFAPVMIKLCKLISHPPNPSDVDRPICNK